MLKKLRQMITKQLFAKWYSVTPDANIITNALRQQIDDITFDHFAVIDLPGPYSGIPVLHQIFSSLGYEERGKDYLASKQNDFLWMAERNCSTMPAHEVLPQVVIADFRLDEMPNEIKKIIYHYSGRLSGDAFAEIKKILQQVSPDNFSFCLNTILKYFSGREWALPTVKEFKTVREFNELLAWVLVFGRKPNHFTFSIHLLNQFDNLEAFHDFILRETTLTLNAEGGVIKGGKKSGIAQGSTMGLSEIVKLADGVIDIPTGFAEFVFRYPLNAENFQGNWGDYFTGFIANHADYVIESLYEKSKQQPG